MAAGLIGGESSQLTQSAGLLCTLVNLLAAASINLHWEVTQRCTTTLIFDICVWLENLLCCIAVELWNERIANITRVRAGSQSYTHHPWTHPIATPQITYCTGEYSTEGDSPVYSQW